MEQDEFWIYTTGCRNAKLQVRRKNIESLLCGHRKCSLVTFHEEQRFNVVQKPSSFYEFHILTLQLKINRVDILFVYEDK